MDALLERDECSRREISRRTGLASSTVSMIISELTDEGLVHRIGKRDQRAAGRREEIVARNPAAAAVIGVHYTTDACTFGVIDFGLNVMEEYGLGPGACAPESIDRCIVDEVGGILARYAKQRNVMGVVVSLPNNPIRRQMVTDRVAGSVHVPVYGINNVVAMAMYYGYAPLPHWSRTFCLVYVGTGVGSGLVIDGRAYHGVHGSASDLGHLSLRDSPIVCRCGLSGCLETFCSLEAISRRIADHYRHSDRLRADALVEFLDDRLRTGDRYAIGLIDSVCSDLARGLRSLVSILDPGLILIVSRLNRLNPSFADRVREHFHAASASPDAQATQLEFCEYRPEAGLVGAGLFFYRTVLGGPGSSRIDPKHIKEVWS